MSFGNDIKKLRRKYLEMRLYENDLLDILVKSIWSGIRRVKMGGVVLVTGA